MSSVTATEITSPAPTAASNAKLISDLKKIVGSGNVLTHPSSTRRFRKGYRTGMGPALAVVRPGTLVEQWRVLNACAAAGKIMIMQAANTGLTGGSTPDGDQYHRDIVIINTDSDGFRNQKTCRIPTFGKRKLYVINADKLFERHYTSLQ